MLDAGALAAGKVPGAAEPIGKGLAQPRARRGEEAPDGARRHQGSAGEGPGLAHHGRQVVAAGGG